MDSTFIRGLPLINSANPCKIILFPLTHRVGKVRDVAEKLVEKSSARAADYYRSQVSDALFKHLEKLGLSEDEQDEQVGAFFAAVDVEAERLVYWWNQPGGKSA
ncbi:DUF6074 family protein [Phyllobacterium sp. 22552]|uniref:DUF6074 family protein n=1 Tax=Phyllobacterium sp. 22552 TaxID=3453941 RepID=UPI003F837CB0